LIQTRISEGYPLTNIPGLRFENPISCVQTSGAKIEDGCLDVSIIQAPKFD
jgi:hypothetical protein